MKSIVSLTVCVSLVFLAAASIATAGVPTLMQYQGVLTDEEGEPLNDTLSMTFTIYPDPNEAIVIWTETQTDVIVANGLFYVLLGSVNPIVDTVFAETERWLGITVAPDPEIVPRTRLVTVPYAFRVATVDGAAGGVISGDVDIQSDLAVSGKATIGPGHTNTGAYAFVAGESNTASGDESTVGGGGGNIAGGFRTTISGGENNSADSAYATVAGGATNTASGERSTVSGGVDNTASNWASTVGGGSSNVASEMYSTVSGGGTNHASGTYSSVSGGALNTASGSYSAVGGGERNLADSSYATVGGGFADTASGWRSTVSGGAYNKASNSGCVVGGGWGNLASGYASTVGGGLHDTASGSGSTVGGGNYNVAEGNWSTVSGGHFNIADGYESTVGGGYYDTASGHGSTVCGGEANHANGTYSTIGGGMGNSNAGDRSAIPGGSYDTLTSNANWSLAFGNRVYLDNQYRVVFFNATYHGRVGINRDDHVDGGIEHPLQVGNSSSNGNGAYLSAGGTWENGSSKTFKENFQSLDSQKLLAKISSLPVEAWQYKDSDERHIGPVSEDFVEAFDVGTVRNGRRDDKYLSPGDVAGVALAGVKELIEENQELRLMIEELKQRIAEFEKVKEKL